MQEGLYKYGYMYTAKCDGTEKKIQNIIQCVLKAKRKHAQVWTNGSLGNRKHPQLVTSHSTEGKKVRRGLSYFT